MRVKPDPQRHHGIPESTQPSRGLIRSTIWSVIQRARSDEVGLAAEARMQLGTYYYNSICRVFRHLTQSRPDSNDLAVELCHEFLSIKVLADGCPLLRNKEKLEKMKSEEDAAVARRSFRNYLNVALRHFLIDRLKDKQFQHASLDGDQAIDSHWVFDGGSTSSSADQDVDELIRTALEEERLHQAIQRLDEHDRRLVEVKLRGETWEDYAARTGGSAVQIRKRWSRHVRRNLRVRLKDLIREESPEPRDVNEGLRECLQWADRQGQLLELLDAASTTKGTHS